MLRRRLECAVRSVLYVRCGQHHPQRNSSAGVPLTIRKVQNKPRRYDGCATLAASTSPRTDSRRGRKSAARGDGGQEPQPKRSVSPSIRSEINMSIIWTIIIGFVAGVIAKLITPGDNEPSGFVLTTILGDRRGVCRDLSGASDRLVPRRRGSGPHCPKCSVLPKPSAWWAVDETTERLSASSAALTLLPFLFPSAEMTC